MTDGLVTVQHDFLDEARLWHPRTQRLAVLHWVAFGWSSKGEEDRSIAVCRQILRKLPGHENALRGGLQQALIELYTHPSVEIISSIKDGEESFIVTLSGAFLTRFHPELDICNTMLEAAQ